MRTPTTTSGRAAVAVALLGLAAAGCGVLDVTNPNNVIEENLETPAAATPIANGVVGAATRALNSMLDVYGTASDELDFVGSQDGFLQLDVGNVSNPVLQFSDNGFRQLAMARWTGDDAIRRLEAFDAAGQIAQNRNDLATAYLYTAIVYVTIGDMLDDFPLASDRATGGAPLGEGNMAQVYDSAVVYLDRGLAVATATGSAPLRTQILAMRARAKYSKALWEKLNPPAVQGAAPAPVADPLVNDAGANADAAAALALMAGADFTLTLTPTPASVDGNLVANINNLGNDLNVRREVRIGQA